MFDIPLCGIDDEDWIMAVEQGEDMAPFGVRNRELRVGGMQSTGEEVGFFIIDNDGLFVFKGMVGWAFVSGARWG